MDGALVVDKRVGMTSHDVVAVARRLLGERRIGHIGTLDPFATGVLVLLVGRATRLARFYRQREKAYRGRIRFGYATDTMDVTGQPAGPDRAPVLTEAALRHALAEFVGTYEQRPPAFSAKKISGVPAYRLARKGRSVEPAAVAVTIHHLELISVDGAFAEFEAQVSSGTYIRSLVSDLGVRMGTGAHLVELRRTHLGEFTEGEALTLEQTGETLAQGVSPVIPAARLLPEIPTLALTVNEVARAQHGRDLEYESDAPRLRLLGPEGELCAIGERIAKNLYHPAVVFAAEQGNASGAAAASARFH